MKKFDGKAETKQKEKKNISEEDKKDKESEKGSDTDTDIFEDLQMKRRPSSPPSLSSSFNILPPIKKENEVSMMLSVYLFNLILSGRQTS